MTAPATATGDGSPFRYVHQDTHFYQRPLELLGRQRLRELQNERFCRLVHEIRANEFFREKLNANGSALKELDDLGKIPVTTKSELVQTQAEFPPYGRLLTHPVSHYPYFHTTGGTTGKPLIWLDTRQDWEGWIRCWNYVYRAAGVTHNDIVFLAFSFGPYISHWAAMAGIQHLGALAISGAGMNSLQRLQMILSRQVTVLVCTPTYALHLAEAARQQGIDLAGSAVRVSIHCGEPGASVPHVREAIQKAWGSAVFDHAGATEAGAWGFECGAGTGSIHVNEAEFIAEVLDPQTGQPVPEGARGELVITNLGRTGMPCLRYCTGDLVEPVYEPCPCGRNWMRIKGGVIGRADDMFIVKGVNIYPSAIDNVVRSVNNVVEYEVEVSRKDRMDDLLLKIEVPEGCVFSEVERALADGFRMKLNLRLSIQQVPFGTLPRYEFKAKRYKRTTRES
jgi:phenylacetate-CoA ligase